MSRSFFARTTRDMAPLLPQHNQDLDHALDNLSLDDLSPRPSTPSDTHQQPPRSPVSASPPASFYRALNDNTNMNPRSPSPSRTKPRKIQFAAPPPPIVQSVVLPSSHNPSRVEYTGESSGFGSGESSGMVARDARGHSVVGTGKAAVDPLVGLERRGKALEKELQILLDAQSAGLVQGFGGGDPQRHRDGMSDAGSSTPTSRSRSRRGTGAGGSSNDDEITNGAGVTPVRQPKKQALGLRGARRGLLRDMRELAEVKNEESLVLQREIERRDDVLEKIKGWEDQIEGFKMELSGTGKASKGQVSESSEIEDLEREERAVDAEIRDLEDRLAQMKARKNWLSERISARVNRREARLSSYRFALKETQSEVKEFLSRPPLAPSVVMGEEEGFMALPVSRRTLEMAREWWQKEATALEERKGAVEKEREALELGAKVWDQAMGTVVEFEDEMRKQMQEQMTDPESSLMVLKQQVENMGNVIRKLQSSVRLAENKGWNLLICALGAELEAFKQGESILRGALENIEGPESANERERGEDIVEESEANSTDDEHDSLPFKRDSQLQKKDSNVSRESEDDGPNLAELLVDHSE
ncbi:hypothetical protein F5884DRAFT_225706 [Xylogone sp. PMI_703]|nr:hypothetical protein F5884DRAFT_225706 [Xylogone sp. PMI_703]